MSFQAYLDNIRKKTGKTADEFRKLAEKNGLLRPGFKAGDIVTWLKKEYSLGHGHAMAIYAVFSGHKVAARADTSGSSGIPAKLSAPAQRALTGAGINNLKQLSKMTEEELSALHGIGPKAVSQLKKAMRDSGISFAGPRKIRNSKEGK